jgi:hypothetical protein
MTQPPAAVPPICSKCGSPNPAVQYRSDGVACYRCDVCKHEWSLPKSLNADEETPPLPAIDPLGG